MPMAVAVLPALTIAAVSVAATVAVNFAMGAISNALSSSPNVSGPDTVPAASLGEQGRDRLQTIRAPAAPRVMVYGRARLGGVIVFAASTGDTNEYLHLVVALAGHELDGVEHVYLGDEEIGSRDGNGNVIDGRFADHARVKIYLGTDTQGADSDLVAEVPDWTTAHALRGIAYLYVRLKFSGDVFPSGIPNITAVVRGRKVYDPRTGLTAWSDNAGLCIVDYLGHNDGLRANGAGEIDNAAWQNAANVSDEPVAEPGGGAAARYTCNGVVRLDQKPIDIMRDLLSSMNGVLIYSQGVYLPHPGTYDTPSVTLTQDDLRGELKVRARPSKRELFNAVRGTFVDPGQGYQPTEFPPVTSATYAAEDGGETLYRDIDLPFTTNRYTAQRIAKQVLERSRQGIVVEFPAKLGAVRLRAWETVNLTIAQMGWSAKPFRINSWTLSADGGVDLVLQEEAAASYAWAPGDAVLVDPAPDTNLPNPFAVAAPGLALSDELALSAAGTVLSRLVIDLLAPADVFVEEYETQYRRSGDAAWISLGTGAATQIAVPGVEDGALYEIRARARNGIGVRSAWATASRTIVGQTAPPADVSGFAVNVIGSNAHLTWTPNADLDLSHYRVRWTPALGGATWGGAADLVARVAKPASSVTVPALIGTYLIKAVDHKGIESVNAVLSESTIAGLESFNAVATQAEHTAFAGTHSGTAAPDGALILDTSNLFDDTAGNFDDLGGNFDAGGGTGNTLATGTYTFAGTIDLGAVYSSRVTVNLAVTALDYANLFDDAGGNFDDRGGEFDGETPSTVGVALEIRTTPDDPGGSPTWSDWRAFTVGDYGARAFQFRAVLTTTDPSVSPAVTVLEVSVDMVDRVAGARDVTGDAAGTAIVFSPAFKTTPAIGVTGNDMATGDYWAVTAQSATGFTVRFFNAAGTGISRHFDWLAKGY